MSLYEIRILNAAGTQLGDGPITSATDWTHTANLDQAGQFAFTMPRDDPRSRYIRPKRVAQCWGFVDGAWQHLGSGIINDAQTIISDDGRAMLQVTGDNLLAELLNRIIRDETFDEEVDLHPCNVRYGETTVGRTFDLAVGDTSSWATYTGALNLPIYIRAPYKFDHINFVVHDAQANGGDGKIYYQTRDGTGDAQWGDFTEHVTNTTLTTAGTASVWFGQSGAITWDIDDLSGWELRDADAVPGVQELTYVIRIDPPVTGWSNFSIADISLRVSQETNDALGRIMSYAPTGWTLDAGHGYTTTQQRAMGAELLSNGGFESYTGTANDTTSDVYPDWNTTGADDGAGRSVLADTSTKHGGNASVCLTTGADGASFGVMVQRVAVEPTTEYTLSYWTRAGANSGQLALALFYLGQYLYLQDSTVTSTTWTQVTHTFTTPVDVDLLDVAFYNPLTPSSSAYLDDVSLRQGGGKAIVLDTQGETVLENLVRISETTGEHFIASPTPRQVLWLGKDVRNSEVRAIAHTDPLAVEGHDDICLIQSLVEVASGVDLISRVYPYGGGSDPVPTLITTTRPIPDGYELDRDNNCLTRTQSVAAYGLIERRLDLPDVTNVSGDTSGGIHGANMVFDRALLYLQRHSATNLALDGGDFPRSYQLQLLKCSRVLMPGYTLHIEYDRYVAGTRTMHVDGDFWITSATVRVDASGVHTVAVTCSTVDQAPRDNNSFVVDLARRVRGMKAHR